MNDEQFFLANAYLDGELTADERRIAEADPEVMTEVEQLRALQAGLRDVPGPTAAARESAISAAMAAFDRSPGTSAAPAGDAPGHTGSPVVPFRPRPAYAKYLGVAAAFVAVAGLGIIVAQGGSGDDDSADTAAIELDGAAERGEAMTEAAGTAEAADSELMITADEAPAEEAVEEGVAAEPMADENPATFSEDSAESTSDAAGGSPTAGADQYRQVPPDFDPAAPITNEAELGVYGVYLIAERDAGRLPPTPNHACVTFEQILAEATFLLDDEPVRVYVDVRQTDGQVAALRTDTCAELSRGSLSAG